MKHYHQLGFSINSQVLLENLTADNIYLFNQGKNCNQIIAWGIEDSFTLPYKEYNSKKTQKFIDYHLGEYIFCALSYDIKNNNTRDYLTNRSSIVGDDDIQLVIPEHVLINVNGNYIYFGSKVIPDLVLSLKGKSADNNSKKTIQQDLRPTVSKSEYIEKVSDVLSEIQHGNIYEMNYCINFNSSFEVFNPIKNYFNLHKNSLAPFSAFVKSKSKYILSASPERFIQKRKKDIISQPIKGTAPRGKDKTQDQLFIDKLTTDPKEIAENVMIVDLVRNDLSVIAEKKTVHVPDLCKLYTFDTVHQLISTVRGSVDSKVNFTSILDAMFPMGSMTGAPKVSAMNIIHETENFDRGMYSGSIGYISPEGNFDFNVVIRSLLVDEKQKKLSASVGGAITIKSIPNNEYEECLLKLNVINKSLC